MRRSFIKIFALVLIFSFVLSGSFAFADSSKSAPSEARNAVARVLSISSATGDMQTGSCFGIGKSGSAPEYFITNAHVVLDSRENVCDEIYILLDNDAVDLTFFADGSKSITDIDFTHAIKCEVVDANKVSLYPDVAVLKASEPVEARTCLPLGSSEKIQPAETVYSLGFPGNMDILTADDNSNGYLVADIEEVTLDSGVVSKRVQSELFGNTDVIMHSASISSGNSGGPLINEDGVAVGINTYGLATSDSQFGSVCIEYAIEILEDNDIAHSGLGLGGDTVKTVVLIAIMVLVAVVAIILIVKFKRGSDRWVENDKRQKYEEANALRIQGVSGHYSGRRFPLEGQVSFGRDPSNSIAFPTDTKGVSANHCIVLRNGSQIYIKDLGSSYGTVVNGTHRLPVNEMVSINVGDRFSLGSERETFIITRKGGKV